MQRCASHLVEGSGVADPIQISTSKPLFQQVAVVTGASRGIGRSIAIALAKAGAHVLVNYRASSDMADETVRECLKYGVRAIAVQADVSRKEEVARLFEACTETLGDPHILVNNAGIGHYGLLSDLSDEEWHRILAVNLTSAFLCIRAALPGMLKRKYGRIINISSIWGIVGGSCETAYSAAKGGLIALTKALAKELGPSGITVNAIAPGAIATDMLGPLTPDEQKALVERTPVGRLGVPDDVSRVALFLALPANSFLTGEVISPHGGLL
jgi:3-oxoacyl-[acyl-carrier protein] reductase